MQRGLIALIKLSASATGFLLSLAGAGAQFVGLTVELEICDWDYMFFSDRAGKSPGETGTPTIFSDHNFIRCIVGTDTWMVENKLPTFDVTRWFTGTNIIEHTVIKQKSPDAVARQISERTGLALTAPPAGHRYTKIFDSVDGNPGRPVRVADLMGFVPARVSWLAFCSNLALKRDSRRIFPPSPMWKESSLAYSGWSDSIAVFQDGLGLPRSISLVSTNGQPSFQYQVHQTTNLLGWTIPLEFYGVQYLPSRSNTWKLHLTIKGRVTAIGPMARPEIPADVMNVVER